MKNDITTSTIIRAYFNDTQRPTRMQYAAQLEDGLHLLGEEKCTAETLEGLVVLSKRSGKSGKFQECNKEGFFGQYIELQNGHLNIPFDDDDL